MMLWLSEHGIPKGSNKHDRKIIKAYVKFLWDNVCQYNEIYPANCWSTSTSMLLKA